MIAIEDSWDTLHVDANSVCTQEKDDTESSLKSFNDNKLQKKSNTVI